MSVSTRKLRFASLAKGGFTQALQSSCGSVTLAPDEPPHRDRRLLPGHVEAAHPVGIPGRGRPGTGRQVLLLVGVDRVVGDERPGQAGDGRRDLRIREDRQHPAPPFSTAPRRRFQPPSTGGEATTRSAHIARSGTGPRPRSRAARVRSLRLRLSQRTGAIPWQGYPRDKR